MNQQEILDLISRFENSCLQTLKLSTPGYSLELSRGTHTAAVPSTFSAPASAAAPAVSAAPAPAVPSASEPLPDSQLSAITAPLVGTYYAAPAPDQPPFVQVGSTVKKGQTVCLIEAMKMMSEIPAPCDCVIEQALKSDGELAAFGDNLFLYRPC